MYAVELLLPADYFFHSLDFNTVSNENERGVEKNTGKGTRGQNRGQNILMNTLVLVPFRSKQLCARKDKKK